MPDNITISMIALIGNKRELGKTGSLIWRLPADLKHFKDITANTVVIMGSTTYTKCIGGPLKNRINVVISSEFEITNSDIYFARNMREAICLAKTLCRISDLSEIFIIGGEQTYRRGMRYAGALYITHVNASDDNADTFFPEIDPVVWQPVSIQACVDEKTNLDFNIVKYLLVA